jgi:hypothetical protein
MNLKLAIIRKRTCEHFPNGSDIEYRLLDISEDECPEAIKRLRSIFDSESCTLLKTFSFEDLRDIDR